MRSSRDRTPQRRPVLSDARRSLAVLLLPALAASVCRAQEHGAADLRKEVEELRDHNRRLEERIENLEGSNAAGGAAHDDPAEEDVVEAGADEFEVPPLGLGLAVRRGATQGALQLFGDVGFGYSNPTSDDGGNTTFFLGSVDIFGTAQVGDHFQILSETNISGKTDNDVEFDQERLWGAWTFTDFLYAKLGVEHGPISRWNRLYHHGKWFQTAISRPFLARFEGGGGILPQHNAGLEVGGTVITGAGQIEYVTALSNGRGETPADKVRVFDFNDDKAIDVALGFIPVCCEALRVGGVFRYDDIPADPGSMVPGRGSSMLALSGGANVELRLGDLEALAEFVYSDNEHRATGENFGHHSGYVQIAYRLGDWVPYTRFDYRNMENTDPFYLTVDRDLDVWQQIIGLRFDFLLNAALTVEFGVGCEERRNSAGNISEGSIITTALQLSWVL